jgi:hypothetical protein
LASSPLARIVADDGRRFLDDSNQTFDVIVVDPPPPVEAAGSSMLYSREFCEVVKKHLSPDGILQTWYPDDEEDGATTSSIAKALTQTFPFVRAFGSFDQKSFHGIHFLASMKPIPITTSATLAGRMPSAAASDFVEWGPKPTAQEQFQLALSNEIALSDLVTLDPQIPAMQDDQPINEYYLLRRLLHIYR